MLNSLPESFPAKVGTYAASKGCCKGYGLLGQWTIGEKYYILTVLNNITLSDTKKLSELVDDCRS